MAQESRNHGDPLRPQPHARSSADRNPSCARESSFHGDRFQHRDCGCFVVLVELCEDAERTFAILNPLKPSCLVLDGWWTYSQARELANARSRRPNSHPSTSPSTKPSRPQATKFPRARTHPTRRRRRISCLEGLGIRFIIAMGASSR